MRRRAGRRGSGEEYAGVAVPPAPGRSDGGDPGSSMRDAAVCEALDERGAGAILPDRKECVACGLPWTRRPRMTGGPGRVLPGVLGS